MAKSTQRVDMEHVRSFSFDVLSAEAPLGTDIDGRNGSRQMKLW